MLIVLWVTNFITYGRNSSNKKPNDQEPLFQDDRELDLNHTDLSEEAIRKEDRLGFFDDAKEFAQNVLNNGSRNPIVFGLDAPWGSGKSSYLALCHTLVWKDADVIEFEFKPVLYIGRNHDMFTLFAQEFLRTLKENKIYTKSLESNFKKFMRSIKTVKLPGIEFGMMFGSDESSETILENIKKDIGEINKKIIIIIDDLDRLYLEDVKSILSVVRNILYIPNITFILCYDTENINTFEAQQKTVHTYLMEASKDGTYSSKADHELNNQKINAYFEKIVQVKKTIFIRRENLLQFFNDELEKLREKQNYNLNFPDIKESFEHFFNEKKYPLYESFLGDIRKVKRIINVIAERKLLQYNPKFVDLNYTELIKLLLIYINYPRIFRDIYAQEVNGGGGFFSVIRSGDAKKPYKNSDDFKKYCKKLNDEEKFLLNEIFDVESKERWNYIESNMRSILFEKSSPIFNGHGHDIISSSKNLKNYLLCIVENAKILKVEQYAFQVEQVKKLKDMSVEDIFGSVYEYNVSNGERPREVFFRTTVQLMDKDNRKKGDEEIITYEVAEKIIEYIVKNISSYSQVNDFSGVYDGLRDSLIYDILFLLDERGWRDKDGGFYGNYDANVLQIAPKIFDPSGIIDQLSDASRGILGLMDALRLLQSCTEGKGSLWKVQRAVAMYEKNNTYNVKKHFLQKLFKIFLAMYGKQNMFKVIENLSDKELLGDFSGFIKTAFKNKKMEVDEEIQRIKNSVSARLIYQFAGDQQSYDAEGTADGGEVAKKMREYLFEICFNIDTDRENARYFIQYLLSTFEWTHEISGTEYKPLLERYTRFLGEEKLRTYWKKNATTIKKYLYSLDGSTRVHTYNYIAIYKDDLKPLFEELNKLL